VDWIAVAIGIAAFVALHRFRVGVVGVVLAAGAIGLAWAWLQHGLPVG
jgi:hypothetical protein